MVWPGWDVNNPIGHVIMYMSSLCMYNCTLYIMPEFTPSQKMLDINAQKGDEDWEIYAECVREAMAKMGNFEINNQQIRTKLEYERFLNFKTNEIVIGDKVFHSNDKPIKMQSPKT